jgi:hypothetical protein
MFQVKPNSATRLCPCIDHRQRLRGAIDRSIAEEQAKANLNSSATPSRTSSGSRKNGTAAGKRSGGKAAANADLADAPANPDPAVFEAAFVIDDSDDPSRAGTPKPDDTEVKRQLQGTTDDPLSTSNSQETHEKGDDNAAAQVADDSGVPSSKSETGSGPGASDLTPEIRQKLRKLEKLEATYPGMFPSIP